MVEPIDDLSRSPLRPSGTFAPPDREAVYRTIFTRRNARGQFLPDAIPEEVLTRILTAAHHAPSVGLNPSISS